MSCRVGVLRGVLGDAHSTTKLPSRFRLEEVEEVLVLNDLAVSLQELRVAVHGLGFERGQTSLRVVGPVLERLGRSVSSST